MLNSFHLHKHVAFRKSCSIRPLKFQEIQNGIFVEGKAPLEYIVASMVIHLQENRAYLHTCLLVPNHLYMLNCLHTHACMCRYIFACALAYTRRLISVRRGVHKNCERVCLHARVQYLKCIRNPHMRTF